MNPSLPPTEALDEPERELARIVRALPGGEPPAALDAKILRAATNAAAASSRPGARWLASAASLWGIGGAAAAVLALGVSWQMMYGTPQPMQRESAPAAAMSDSADDSPVAVEFKQEPARETAAPAPAGSVAGLRAPPRKSTARLAMPTAAPSGPPPPTEPRAFAEDPLDEHVTARAGTRSEADAGANVEAMAAAPAVADSVGHLDSADMAKSSVAETSAPTANAQAMGATARARDQRRMQPADWLAEVRQLRDAQKTVEARASLLEFRRRYPGFVIPSDLAPLLRE